MFSWDTSIENKGYFMIDPADLNCMSSSDNNSADLFFLSKYI